MLNQRHVVLANDHVAKIGALQGVLIVIKKKGYHKKKIKEKEVKTRKPIAPPSIRHKSKKDYDRKIEKKVKDEEFQSLRSKK